MCYEYEKQLEEEKHQSRSIKSRRAVSDEDERMKRKLYAFENYQTIDETSFIFDFCFLKYFIHSAENINRRFSISCLSTNH